MTPVDPTPVVPAEPSLVPTRKWVVAQVVAIVGLVVMYATNGSWTHEETVAVAAWVVQAVSTWLTPNLAVPGGVPFKRR